MLMKPIELLFRLYLWGMFILDTEYVTTSQIIVCVRGAFSACCYNNCFAPP